MAKYSCKNCGAELFFDPTVGKLHCEYCDSLFDPSEFEYKPEADQAKGAAKDETVKQGLTEEEIKAAWKGFKGRAQELDLPSAPKQFLHYFEEPDRPQAKLDRDREGGMAVTLGRLRPDTQYDYKFVGLSHNTLRGAAGGGVLLAELLCAEGYIQPK